MVDDSPVNFFPTSGDNPLPMQLSLHDQRYNNGSGDTVNTIPEVPNFTGNAVALSNVMTNTEFNSRVPDASQDVDHGMTITTEYLTGNLEDGPEHYYADSKSADLFTGTGIVKNVSFEDTGKDHEDIFFNKSDLVPTGMYYLKPYIYMLLYTNTVHSIIVIVSVFSILYSIYDWLIRI